MNCFCNEFVREKLLIFPKLRKKSIKFISRHCLYVFQHITGPTLGIFIQNLTGTKQRIHHRCPLASIQVPTEQISLLAHHHITNLSFCIRVVYRHLRDIQIMGQFVTIANQVIQCLKEYLLKYNTTHI